ncbi:uncharacterized protein LOC129915057 [Episyrphus balteatus]|uniref:uncharacterized protein LOC129915057 n=1 Tax=Episyrphus balteatus TaxID=286459 RepID=UPI0024852C4E|nr:uncharacterized protein LOC129915057 [Episyrphus balteatus]
MRAFLALCFIAVASGQGYNYDVNTVDSPEVIGSSSNENNVAVQSAPTPSQTITELNKEIYLYSAPEEPLHSSANSQDTIVKKKVQIIFVKAPENNVLPQVAKQITEHQTAIFILNRQPDTTDISQQLQQISEIHSQKPEVHFVKYRTAQDALNAQQTIQAQYDALGGVSKSSNVGVAEVLDYASSAPASTNEASASQLSASITGSPASGSASYLPPAVI